MKLLEKLALVYKLSCALVALAFIGVGLPLPSLGLELLRHVGCAASSDFQGLLSVSSPAWRLLISPRRQASSAQAPPQRPLFPCLGPPPTQFCTIHLLPLQVNRGTIACRRDPDDKAEWQFRLKKSVDWVQEEEKHELQGEATTKVEAVEWMKLRAEGLLVDAPAGNSEANAALKQVSGRRGHPQGP